jgi:leucyl-tRNA synthetase
MELKDLLWPKINENLLHDENLRLPIQIKGKLVATIDTIKGYNEDELLKEIYKLEKIKNRIVDKKIIKVINVQDKIINIITS